MLSVIREASWSFPVPPAALAALAPYLQPYQTTQNVNAFLGKVDWDASPLDRFMFRYNLSRYLGKNQENAFGASAEEHTGNNEINTDNVNGAYTRILGSNMVWESRYNFRTRPRTRFCQREYTRSSDYRHRHDRPQ
jgi:hypothetical protein